MSLEIDNRLADRVSVSSFVLRNVTVLETLPSLDEAIAARARELTSLYPDPPAAIEALRPAREIYRALGIDPSKLRPASEALLRRILLGKGLYRVNTAVDAANLASLRYLLPVGLYDAERIDAEGSVVFRLGAAGEEYPGIGKEMIHLEGRPCLLDRIGPFGNPSSDSWRTRVTLETRELLFVLYAPRPAAEAELLKYRELSIETLKGAVGGLLA